VHGLTRRNGGGGGKECSCRDGDACDGSVGVSFVAKLHYIGVTECYEVSVYVRQDGYMLCVMPETASSEC